jgi:hypothetical protein
MYLHFKKIPNERCFNITMILIRCATSESDKLENEENGLSGGLTS